MNDRNAAGPATRAGYGVCRLPPDSSSLQSARRTRPRWCRRAGRRRLRARAARGRLRRPRRAPGLRRRSPYPRPTWRAQPRGRSRAATADAIRRRGCGRRRHRRARAAAGRPESGSPAAVRGAPAATTPRLRAGRRRDRCGGPARWPHHSPCGNRGHRRCAPRPTRNLGGRRARRSGSRHPHR